MSTIYVISSFILLAASFALASPPLSRIVNGVLVQPGEFPYVVSLQLNDKHICGGLIYNDRFVLTAASCVKNIVDVADLFVNVADLDFLDDEEVDQEAYSVLNIVLAPEDDGNPGQDDLAVIHLTRPLIFGPNVNCIRVGEVEPTGSSKGVIIGFGASGSGGLPSNRCRKGDVTLAGSCPTNNWPNYLESYMICAGTADDVQKPCDFDYGSPLVQDGVAVGILSQQNNCQSSPYDSSIYIRLASYYYWIREEANTQPSNCFKATVTTTNPTQTPSTTATSTTVTTTERSTVSTVASSFTCTEDGYWPIDPNQCLPNFIICLNGVAYNESCPNGSVFDPVALVCLSEGPFCKTSTTPGTSVTLTPVDPNNLCCPGVGQYPLSGSCTQYIVCASNLEPVIANCRVGQVFNPYLGVCDDPANVPGCDFFFITDYIQGFKKTSA